MSLLADAGHLFSDVIALGIALLATWFVYFSNWTGLDVAVSLFIACLVGLSAIPLLRDGLEVLMEYAPPAINPARVKVALESFATVCEVEKLHIWTIGTGQVAFCAHITVKSTGGEERDRLLKQLQTYLEQEFDIRESTLQLTNCNSMKMAELHPLMSGDLWTQLTEKKRETSAAQPK